MRLVQISSYAVHSWDESNIFKQFVPLSTCLAVRWITSFSRRCRWRWVWFVQGSKKLNAQFCFMNVNFMQLLSFHVEWTFNIEDKLAKIPFHTLVNEPGISGSSSKYRTVLLNIDFLHEFNQYVNMSPLPWKEGKKFCFIGALFLLGCVNWYIYLGFRPKSFEKRQAWFQKIISETFNQSKYNLQFTFTMIVILSKVRYISYNCTQKLIMHTYNWNGVHR